MKAEPPQIVSTSVGKTKCRDMNGTTPSSNVLTASIEVLYVSIAKDLKLDTKFSILAFFVFLPNMPIQVSAAT